MKTVISIAIALALALSVVPAMAEDTFQALSNVSAGEQQLLTPLSDEQLSAIEGTNPCNFFKGSCANLKFARIDQDNKAVRSKNVYQSNTALIVQDH
jgi:hypothetical protein